MSAAQGEVYVGEVPEVVVKAPNPSEERRKRQRRERERRQGDRRREERRQRERRQADRRAESVSA